MDKVPQESGRIRETYRRYQASDHYHRIWYDESPGNLFLNESVKKSLLGVLTKHGLTELDRLKVLDVGCGGGQILTYLVGFGSNEDLLYGVDLIEERLKEAKAKLVGGHFQCADASSLPYRDHSFDLVMQFTMLSSVLNGALRKKIAGEIMRVLKPGGTIVSFDTRYWNPQNPNTRPVREWELRSYFAPCRVQGYPILLIPQVARVLAPLSVGLCRLLERVPMFRSHYLAVIQTNASRDP